MRRYQLLFAAMLTLLSSCYSSRKAKIDEAVKLASLQQEQELAAIGSIERTKTRKLDEGSIDSTIDKTINSRLKTNKSRVDATKKIIEELTSSSRDRKSQRKSNNKIIKSKLVYLANDKQLFEKRMVNYGMISEVLDKAGQSQFDLATFFGPGEFIIPADKIEQAITAFTPVVDSMLKFAARYPGLPKNSTLVLKGYADATGILPGSELYYRLSNQLKEANPGRAALNLALSKLRTESISTLVSQVIQKKHPEFTKRNIVHIELIQEGRGEEKPNVKIHDYTDDDSRRRIVLFFWSLLPV